MYSYLRSPFRDLYVYDKMVQVRVFPFIFPFGCVTYTLLRLPHSPDFSEQYDEPGDFSSRRQQQIRRDSVEIEFRPSSPSGNNDSRPKRPSGNYEGGRRQLRAHHDTSLERKRKRSRSRSHDSRRVKGSRDPSPNACTPQRDRSESQTLVSSSEPSSPAPHPQAVKGKGKAVELGIVANSLDPSAGGSGTARTTIDKSIGSAQIRERPNAEHTVIGISKRGKRDRTPKALTLRQSVQAHLSLQKAEPLKVSRSVAEPESATPGPDLRHGRPSLLERISGMEGAPQSQPIPVSAARPDVSTSPGSGRLLRSAAAEPRERSGGASNNNININYAEEDIIDIDNHRPDPISNVTHQDNADAQAGCADRTPRVNPRDVLERTRVRLAKMKNVMVAGVPPTAPTPPPIALDPSTPAEPEETVAPAPDVIATLRNRLLERLESERRDAIGAASGEPGVEPVAGNASEDSLRAELRARNQLRARLAVAKADRHVGNLEA